MVTAVVLVALAGTAEAATVIRWDNSLPAGTYNYFDTNNWADVSDPPDGIGDIPDSEGESALFQDWRDKVTVVDLAGGVVDLYGTGGDPGNFDMLRNRTESMTLIDSSVGKTSYIKVNQFIARYWGRFFSEVPIIAMDQLKVNYRGCYNFTQSNTVTTPLVNIGLGSFTLNAPPSGTNSIQEVMFFDDMTNSGFQWLYTPEMIANADVQDLAKVTVDFAGDYEAHGDGTLGSGVVDILNGTVLVGSAQTTFPSAVSVGTATWQYAGLAGNLTGATYGAGGNVSFQAGTIVGDTSGGGNNPSRTDAGGATLYQPIVNLAAGNTHLSGDDGAGPYKGVALGRWSSTADVAATIQARAGSGNLQIAVAGMPVNFSNATTLQGSDTTTADIKIFPGDGRIILGSGGINEDAIAASTPNLITTFNIAGVAGDRSPDRDRIASDEKWVVFETSGTGKILPGQTVRITDGVYLMDVGGAVDTIGGTLQIGPGGTLELRDSTISDPAADPFGKIQSTATGRLEIEDRGLLNLVDGDTLGTLTPAQVSVSGTPLLSFFNAHDGYYATWKAEITIDAAANPALAKIMAESDIILHSSYHVYSNQDRRNKFLGDGLKVREGGIVTTPRHLYGNPAADAGIHQDTVYFGPAVPGGSFTIAAPPDCNFRIYGEITAPGSTIYIGSDSEIETITNTGWYPYHTEMARVSVQPTGPVLLYNVVDADKLVVKSGSLTTEAETVDDLGVTIQVDGGTARLKFDFAEGSAGVNPGGYLWVSASGATIKDLTINSAGAYQRDVSGVRINNNLQVFGTLSGTGQWGDGRLIVAGGGEVAPGGSTGTLTGANAFEMQAGATYQWELADPDGVAGTDWDLIDVTGALTLANDWILRMNDGGLTRNTEASEEFDIFNATGAIALGTVILEAGDTNWDVSGASVNVDGLRVYLTGLVATSAIPGDANNNGFVDDDDLAILLSNWEQDAGTVTNWALGDFTGDTDIDDDDLAVLLGNWTGPPPGGAGVPEPATMALLGLGGLSVLRRRRK